MKRRKINKFKKRAIFDSTYNSHKMPSKRDNNIWDLSNN
jgi:hypothetical protein